MKLPDFIIAGATRSGTSTLFEALRKNHNLFLPEQKELHYFYRDGDFEKGNEFYAQYFKDAPESTLCGDISPTYLTHGYTLDHDLKHKWQPENDSAIRLHQTFPEMKIIITLRHPAARAHSFFYRTVWQGHEKAGDFEQAIDEELAGSRTPQKTPLCPLYLSHYKTHLEHWLNHFSKGQILLLIMEEWTQKPAKTIRHIEDFIGAPPSGLTDEAIKPANQGRSTSNPLLKPLSRIFPKSRIMRKLNRRLLSKTGYDKIAPQTLGKLNPVFEEDIAYVEKYLGRPITAWRNYKP